MNLDLLHQRIINAEITAEHLKRIYDMALFERSPDLDMDHEDRQSLKALHDLIGLIAEYEFDLEDKIEGLEL